MRRNIATAGALFGASAVVLGAFGAHALKETLAAEQAGWWETAVQYQMWHGLALLVIAILPLRRPGFIALCISMGIFLFSGTLFAMALGLPRWLGAVTPFGGASLIAGWLVLAWDALHAPGGDPKA